MTYPHSVEAPAPGMPLSNFGIYEKKGVGKKNSVAALTQTCDYQNDDDDFGSINCVCSFINTTTLIPAYEACISKIRNDDKDHWKHRIQ